jgi:acyl-CoA reductase-like NAD-dependent aldehyde dehydrogenase
LSTKTKPSIPVVPQMDKEEVKALIEQSDEYKMWKNIPKAQRERLTTK